MLQLLKAASSSRVSYLEKWGLLFCVLRTNVIDQKKRFKHTIHWGTQFLGNYHSQRSKPIAVVKTQITSMVHTTDDRANVKIHRKNMIQGSGCIFSHSSLIDWKRTVDRYRSPKLGNTTYKHFEFPKLVERYGNEDKFQN